MSNDRRCVVCLTRRSETWAVGRLGETWVVVCVNCVRTRVSDKVRDALRTVTTEELDALLAVGRVQES